jgi:putative phosphoserine phosphatase/1-acylglycerol-3-phosphate O-acyltransferase
MAAISELLPPEAHEARVPTEDELRSTYPGGRIPD